MWKVILTVATCFMTAGLVKGQPSAKFNAPAPLNHFYIVLDSETYKAIEQDSFLRKSLP